MQAKNTNPTGCLVIFGRIADQHKGYYVSNRPDIQRSDTGLAFVQQVITGGLTVTHQYN